VAVGSVAVDVTTGERATIVAAARDLPSQADGGLPGGIGLAWTPVA
jgi:hypothetical protein